MLNAMSQSGTARTPTLRENYRRVMDRIAEAASRVGRRPSDILLVAVTKNAAPDQIRELVEMGHADLGENRVQQLSQRVPALDEWMGRRRFLAHAGGKPDPAPAEVRWHMIGHLQRNKVKQVVPLVRVIHSVDSLRLAEELHALGARREKPIDILLQVNSSGEESKFGVATPAALPLAEQIDTMVHVRLRGLMTMAPEGARPEETRAVFQRCAELFQEVRATRIGGEAFNLLSMGMSNDFEIAIEEGANIVRVGTALFGPAVD